jgi:hypothetical protein
LIEITAKEGFTGHVIATGSEKVQVHFVGAADVIPSWVLCEGGREVTCAFD